MGGDPVQAREGGCGVALPLAVEHPDGDQRHRAGHPVGPATDGTRHVRAVGVVTLTAPAGYAPCHGPIPGTSVAEGAFVVSEGTLIGPVQPGA